MLKPNVPKKIEVLKTSKLLPYARNSRTHSDAQVQQIAASMAEFGFTNPILIDENDQIIAGHGRLSAAHLLKIDEVPCIRLSHLSETQKKAYVIADNKLALNAGWDDAMLALELKDLESEDFDLSLTGFNDDELAKILVEAVEGQTDPDDVPEVQDTAITVLGDIWVLGKHMLVCGDSTNINNWDKLNIESGFVCFTSPPYNLGKSAKLSGNKKLKKSGNAYDDYGDDKSGEDYSNLINEVLTISISYCDCSAFNVQPLAGSKRELLKLFDKFSSNLIDIITWDKKNSAPQMAEGVLSSRYEWIVLFSKDMNASRRIPLSSWRGKYSSVYEAPPQRKNEFASIHGATFPVHLPEYMIGDLMNRSRGVVDCFMGTGTTLIAAEKLNKECRGIELSPQYCDVIIRRWQDFTGKNAVHSETGKTFNEMMNERSNNSSA